MMFRQTSHPTKHGFQFSYYSYMEEKVRQQEINSTPTNTAIEPEHTIDVQEADTNTAERIQREWDKLNRKAKTDCGRTH